MGQDGTTESLEIPTGEAGAAGAGDDAGGGNGLDKSGEADNTSIRSLLGDALSDSSESPTPPAEPGSKTPESGAVVEKR